MSNRKCKSVWAMTTCPSGWGITTRQTLADNKYITCPSYHLRIEVTGHGWRLWVEGGVFRVSRPPKALG